MHDVPFPCVTDYLQFVLCYFARVVVVVVQWLALHCSSIGMAKAALEAINGANVFGEVGANWSVIFIDIDAHYRNRTNFDTLLPRESASKVGGTEGVY